MIRIIRKLAVLFIFISFSVGLAAQGNNFENPIKKIIPLKGTLKGKITDKKNNQFLPGATVYIADLKIGAVAGNNGEYSFLSLPSGSFLLEVRHVGYKTETRNVSIEGDVIENFEMEDNFIEESAVVVTGQSKATQIKRSPIPIVSVSHDNIIKTLSTNIIDAISKVPGVNALTTGPNISKPFIRGLGYNRILTLYDGVRQEGQQWGDEHGVEVDQYGIEKAEVIKGPSSLSYGSDALAGVVNLIPTQPVPQGKFIGDLITEYQTNNGLIGSSIMLGRTKKDFEWVSRISHKTAADYRNRYDGRVYSTAFRETDLSIALGLHGKWGYSHLGFALYDDLQEIPDGSRDSATRKFTKQITEIDTLRPIVTNTELATYKINDIHQHVQHYRLFIANNFTIGQGRLTVNGGFQRSVRREYNHPVFTSIPGLFLQMNTLPYVIKYYLRNINGWDLTAGVNGMLQVNTVTNGTDFIIPSYKQFDIGPFLLLKKTFGKMDIAGGLRYDNRNFSNNELYTRPDLVTSFDKPVFGIDTIGAEKHFSKYAHNFSGMSGSIGATFNFSDKLSLKANIARGYRAPNISEISSNGVHPGTNIYQIGNSDFKPEFNLQEDIGLTYASRYAVLAVSIFNNTITNYIFNQRLLNRAGNDSVLIPGNQTYKFQQTKARLYGGEANLDIHPIKALHFENSIAVVMGKNLDIDPKLQTDSNKYLPFIPPFHGTSELRYDFENRKLHLVNGFVKLQLAYYATQNKVYLTDNTETATPGYALLNAGVGTGITNKKGHTFLNVYLNINNLADVAYQDHLSRLKYFEPYPTDPRTKHGIYNMGRNLSLKLNFPLDFTLLK